VTAPTTPRRVPGIPTRVAVILLTVAFAFPGAYLVIRNFTLGSDPFGLLVDGQTLAPLWRTLTLAVTVSAVATALGVGLAWLTSRTDLPGVQFWRVVLPLPLVFPTFVGAAAFIRTLNPGGLASDVVRAFGLEQTPELRGFTGAFIVLTVFTYPYVYLPVVARLRRMPGSLEESARLLGDRPAQVFSRVVLPQAWTAIGAGGLLVFLYVISDFGAVQLMRYDTLTRAIETNYLARPPVAFAMSLILVMLAAAVVTGERLLIGRHRSTATGRTSRPVHYRLGRSRVPALVAVGLVTSVGIVAPLVSMADWAWDGLRAGRSLTIDADDVVEASVNTLESSVFAAVAAVIAVLPIAYLFGRHRSRLAGLSHGIVIATFALPGILIALSLHFWTLQWDVVEGLRGTKPLLVFAYVVRFGSLAMGTVLVAVQTVPDRFHDAAATLGASARRRLGTIDLPLMLPGLLAAAGLVLLSTMKELPITLIVAPFEYPTLTTRIFGSFEDAFVAEAGIMAIVLVALSAVLTWFLVLRRGEVG